MKVNIENGAIEQGDGDELQGAGGESFEAAPGGEDLQDHGADEEVGSQDEHSGGDDIGGEATEQRSLVGIFSSTSQLLKRWDITEKVINDIVTAEVQGKSSFGNNESVSKATKVWGCYKKCTQLAGHDLIIEQWLWGGHIAVISHGKEQETPSVGQPGGEEELGHTASEGDAFVFREAGQ